MIHISKFRKISTGFTLMEMLIAFALFIVIMIGVYNVLLVGQKACFSGLGAAELQSQSRLFVSLFSREFREAKSFSVTPVSGNDDIITFSTPNESSITYYRDTGDLNGDGVTTQIIREYPSGQRRVVASNVDSLKFSSSGKLLQVSVTARKNSGGRTITQTTINKVEARNE